jgi:hypothetical protein
LFRAKGLSRLERPKTVKEREDDASQLNRLSRYDGFAQAPGNRHGLVWLSAEC